MYKARPMEKHYVSLGKLATVFQAEITAIDQCAMRNVEKGYKNRTICIVSGSKAAIKSLSSNYFTRKGVWCCYNTLEKLAEENQVKLILVPGHQDITGNEKADKLATKGAGMANVGPEHT